MRKIKKEKKNNFVVEKSIKIETKDEIITLEEGDKIQVLKEGKTIRSNRVSLQKGGKYLIMDDWLSQDSAILSYSDLVNLMDIFDDPNLLNDIESGKYIVYDVTGMSIDEIEDEWGEISIY